MQITIEGKGLEIRKTANKDVLKRNQAKNDTNNIILIKQKSAKMKQKQNK